jgi:hypothetical protein
LVFGEKQSFKVILVVCLVKSGGFPPLFNFTPQVLSFRKKYYSIGAYLD